MDICLATIIFYLPVFTCCYRNKNFRTKRLIAVLNSVVVAQTLQKTRYQQPKEQCIDMVDLMIKETEQLLEPYITRSPIEGRSYLCLIIFH